MNARVDPAFSSPWGKPHKRDAGGPAVLVKGGESLEVATKRHDQAIAVAPDYFTKKERAALEELGTLHCWTQYHFQIIDEEGLALNIWAKGGRRQWSWRVPGSPETERGDFNDLLNVIKALTI